MKVTLEERGSQGCGEKKNGRGKALLTAVEGAKGAFDKLCGAIVLLYKRASDEKMGDYKVVPVPRGGEPERRARERCMKRHLAVLFKQLGILNPIIVMWSVFTYCK